eukprot:ANDGO_05233.mRNA.1 hypothetical protein
MQASGFPAPPAHYREYESGETPYGTTAPSVPLVIFGETRKPVPWPDSASNHSTISFLSETLAPRETPVEGDLRPKLHELLSFLIQTYAKLIAPSAATSTTTAALLTTAENTMYEIYHVLNAYRPRMARAQALDLITAQITHVSNTLDSCSAALHNVQVMVQSAYETENAASLNASES